MAVFKLLAGQHECETFKDDPKGEFIPSTGKWQRVYKAGEFIETEQDLSKRFGYDKFFRVPDHEIPPSIRKRNEQKDSVAARTPNGSDVQVSVNPARYESATAPTSLAPPPGTVKATEESPIYTAAASAKTKEPEKQPEPESDSEKGFDLAFYGDLSKKTVKELRDIADAEEIDLGHSSNKEDIIKKIKAAA